MDTKTVVQNFYSNYTQKNDEWSKDLAENVVFSDASGKLHAEGKEEFIQAFTPFLKSVEKVELNQLIVEGENVAAVVSYDYISPTRTKLHQDDAEIWKVVNGKITELTIYFDITEFRAFMGR